MSRHGLLRSLFAAAALLGAAGVFAASAEPLRLEVYNPGEKAIFAVSSELLVGQREAMLIDAQFSRADAEQLVKRIQASGKTLSTIYISHGDPDFYFGLDVLKAAFPEAKILATAQTVAHIQATKDAKLAYWGRSSGQRADVAGGAGAAEGRPVEAGRPCPEGGRPEGAERTARCCGFRR